ncbi:hypothetical protein D9M69_506520 [compost metagenome]
MPSRVLSMPAANPPYSAARAAASESVMKRPPDSAGARATRSQAASRVSRMATMKRCQALRDWGSQSSRRCHGGAAMGGVALDAGIVMRWLGCAVAGVRYTPVQFIPEPGSGR